MASIDSLQARYSALASGLQPTPVPTDPVVLTSVLTNALSNLSGLVAPGATKFASLNAAYFTVNSRALFNSDNPNGPQNWLGEGAGGSANHYAYGGFAQGVFLSGLGDVGIVGATRTTDITTINRLSIGNMGWAFNFNTVAPVFAWAGYFEARRKTGAGAVATLEANITELGSTDVFTPSAKGSGPNAIYNYTSCGIALAVGGNATAAAGSAWDGTKLTNAVDASVALAIYNNGAAAKKGIIIGEGALTGCTGVGGTNVGTALEVPRGAQLTWIDGSIRQAAKIWSDISSGGNPLNFTLTDFGFLFNSSNGGATLQVVSKPTDAFGVQVVGGTTSQGGATIIASGATNANLTISANGTGQLYLVGAVTTPNLINAANDSAAASAGVPVNSLYRNGSNLMVRVS